MCVHAWGGGGRERLRQRENVELSGSPGVMPGPRKGWEGCLVVEGTSLPSQGKGQLVMGTVRAACACLASEYGREGK